MSAAVRLISWAVCAAVAIGCGSKPVKPPEGATVHALTTPIDENTQAFFLAPWPDDRRLASDGTVTTANFPNPNGGGTLAATLLQTGDHLIHGWGVAAPIYMPFSGTIDPNSLPSDPRAADGSVFLVDIDPASPNRGQRAYVDFHYYADPTLFLQGNVLAVRPVPGFPLRPKTKYAVVVTTDVKDLSGKAVTPEAAFNDVLTGHASGGTEESAATFYRPLLDELARESFPVARVAGATIFTTQPVIDEMLVLRDYLLSLPAPAATLKFVSATPDYQMYEGSYQAPNMQHGAPPFLQTGGDFQYDAAGKPLVGFMETMRLSVMVPTTPMPGAGYPIMLYSHGTGGNYLSIVQEGEAIGPPMAKNGLAGFGIDQILTGPRSGLAPASQPTGCFGQPIEDCFIDPVNAVAGRNNLRQSALDNVTLRQVAFNLTIPASVNPKGTAITFDKTRFGFIGHSQGGLTGAIYAAIEPELLGAVISGSGGLVSGTILERKNPSLLPILNGPLFLNIAPTESLEPYHPVLALIQTLAEAVDPLNFSVHWIKTPQGRAKNIFTTSGLNDTDTPPDLAENLNAAGGIPELSPWARDSKTLTLAGLVPVKAPVTGNITPANGPAVTAVFRQFQGEGHFPIFDNKSCRKQWSTFLQTMLTNGVATVPAD